MASPARLATPAQSHAKPIWLLIIGPFIFWGFLWLALPLILGANHIDVLAERLGRMVGVGIFAFLLGYFAAGGRKRKDWLSFSQWFGGWMFLAPLLPTLYYLPAFFISVAVIYQKSKMKQ